MPQEKPKKLTASGRVGDGGLSWMKRAYQRCVEQAKEEGRTLEDIATEKYGVSLKIRVRFYDFKLTFIIKVWLANFSIIFPKYENISFSELPPPSYGGDFIETFNIHM